MTGIQLTSGQPVGPVAIPNMNPSLWSALPSPDAVRTFATRIGWRTLVAMTVLLIAGVGLAGPSVIALVGAVALLTGVYFHPPLAGYTMLGVAPWFIGFERGSLVPLLRPNEALLFVLIGVVILRRLRLGEQLRIRLTSIDLAMVALTITASLLPLLMAIGRLRPVGFDDVLYAVTFVKLLLLYGLFRSVITTPTQVRLALWSLLATAGALGVLGALDGRNVAGTAEWLALYFPVEEGPADDGRGAATIGNAIGAGGYQAIAFAAGLAMWLWGERPRLLILAGLAGCSLGVLGSGQFTAFIGVAVSGLALGYVTRSSIRLAMQGLPLLIVAVLLMLPVLQERADGFNTSLTSSEMRDIELLPPQEQVSARLEINPGSSWDVRWHNIETYFLPAFDDPSNVLLGVTPQARARAVEPYRDWVWIESGYLWLVWTGGIPLVIAFVVLLVTGASATRRIARARYDPVGQAAAGAFAAIVTLAVIQGLDPHLTLRGTADVFYPLLALAQTGSIGRALFAYPDRTVDLTAVAAPTARPRLSGPRGPRILTEEAMR